MSNYTLSHVTSQARCAWCWQEIADRESHAVVSARGGLHLELHFHHRCWPPYRSLSEIEGGADVRVIGDWTPQRIEMLRIHGGFRKDAFAKHLGVSEDTLLRIMSGDESALGPGVEARIKTLAIQTRFERRDTIDWTQGVAVFCLRMTLDWSLGKLAEEIGCSAQSVRAWQWSGVSLRSMRVHGRLTVLARRNHFDAGMIVPHRLWTREYLEQQFRDHPEHSRHEWARAAGCSKHAIAQWLTGTRPITPEGAWHLTRAAAQLGVPLPPEGLVEARKGLWGEARKIPSQADEQRRLKAMATSKWDLDKLMVLGTVPDREAAKRVGKSLDAIKSMRRSLRIPACDLRDWDGQERPPALSREELQARWDEYRQRHAERQRSRR